MISQLTVFLQNEKGRLAAACRAISDAGINMHSLFLADTQDFGVVRLLVDHPKQAAEALRKFMDSENVNGEYGYCFSVGEGYAIDVLKTDEDAQLEEKLVKAGFNPVSPEEIYAVD